MDAWRGDWAGDEEVEDGADVECSDAVVEVDNDDDVDADEEDREGMPPGVEYEEADTERCPWREGLPPVTEP